MSAETIALPNPLTPLAWLPSDIGAQLQASGYLFVATIGAWGWDLLMSSHEEYRVLFKHRISLPHIIYVIARIFSCAYIVQATVFQVADVGDCNKMITAIGAVGTIAVPANSLLMYFRVSALYAHQKIVVAAFTFLWIATLAGCITAPFSLKAIHIGTTQRCIDSEVKGYGSAGIVISAVNDTLIFLAITYKLVFYHIASESWSARATSFWKGEGMGQTSKLLLKTGQLYYLATAGMNILTVVSILAPSFPPVLHAMFTVPNIALTNAMACRVYRQLRLGLLMDHPATTQLSQQSAPIQLLPTTNSRYRRSAPGDTESVMVQDDSTITNKGAILAVHIQRETTEHTGDLVRQSSPPLKPAGLAPA